MANPSTLQNPGGGLLVEAAGVQPGQRVLDVACGTAAVTRLLADRVGRSGRIVGLDFNVGMLTAARAAVANSLIEWLEYCRYRLHALSQSLRTTPYIETVKHTKTLLIADKDVTINFATAPYFVSSRNADQEKAYQEALRSQAVKFPQVFGQEEYDI